MNTFWRMINSAIVVLSFCAGYGSMSPGTLRHSDPDGILCLIILVLLPLFSVGSVAYSIYRQNQETFQRPSWDRNPSDWWHDPLQSLFISTWAMAGMTIGSALRCHHVGSVGFWMLGAYFCAFGGLLIGQAMVYGLYRKRILKPNNGTEAIR